MNVLSINKREHGDCGGGGRQILVSDAGASAHLAELMFT